MIRFIEPYTKQWYQERLGCFTASKCVKLLKGGTRPMTAAELSVRDANNKAAKALDKSYKSDTRKTVDTLLGEAALTYINEKVAELVNRQSKDTPTTAPMRRGLDLENEAIEMFNKITGLNAVTCGLFKLNLYTAGTPDFIIGKRKVLYVGEIKSLNPENHSELSEIETVEQLRAYDESFYAQLQMNMYVTGAKGGYFISYDPRAMGVKDDGEIDEELYDPEKFIFCIKIVKVKRDEPFITELKKRLDAAAGVMVMKLEKRMKTASKNLAMYNRTQQRKAA